MTRSMLAVTIVCFAFVSVARPTDVSKSATSPKLTPAKAAPLYVKIIWPVDPATPGIEKDRPVVESWIAKNIKNWLQGGFTAATGWVPLVENRNEATAVWDGKLDGKDYACAVSADITERKDGRIKILLKGWGPDGGEVTVVLDDEPGSREVVPVTDAKTRQGIPYVAIFIGLQAK